MVTNISHRPAETEALGEEWGRAAEPGWVIALSGDLGAGKTQWVKGLARGLGYTGRVHSPTFALVNAYHGGRLSLFHLDLYRLETCEQIIAAGLEEYLQPVGVAVIEWAERWLEDPRNHPPDIAGPGRFRNEAQASPSASSGSVPLPARSWRQPVPRLRWVRIEGLSETDRRIEYEDFGA